MPAGDRDLRASQWLSVASLILLAGQAVLPWTVPVYATQDGASHVYNAHAAWQVLFHGDSPYAAVYQLNPRPIPNWTVTVLLWAATAVVGVAHAEQLVASFVVLAGFAALSYALRVFAGLERAYSPLVNALLSSWFLFLGFYNFYLGAALAVACVAYVASRKALGRRELLTIAAGALALYFTHLVAWGAAIAGCGVFLLRRRRDLAAVAAAVLPSALLACWYALTNPGSPALSGAVSLFDVVGGTLAIAARGPANQTVLTVMLLLGMVLAASSRKLKHSAYGVWAFAVAVLFAVLTVLAPGAAGGGSFIRERMWWFALAFGTMGWIAVLKSGRDRLFAELVVTVALAASLVHTHILMREAGETTVHIRDMWRNLPAGTRVLKATRMDPQNPPLPVVRNLRLDPLMHAEAVPAAEAGVVDLADYAASKEYFPLIYRRDRFSRETAQRLGALEVALPGDLEKAEGALPFAPDAVFELQYPAGSGVRFEARMVSRKGGEVLRSEWKAIE